MKISVAFGQADNEICFHHLRVMQYSKLVV